MSNEKTYGQQLVENIEKNQGFKFAETREVTLEYGKNVFLPWLEKNVIQEKKYDDWPIVWILIMAKKSIHENIMNVVFGVTPNEPIMQLKCMLYSYKPKKNELLMHWMLPQTLEMVRGVIEYADGFDPFYVKSCKGYLELLSSNKNKQKK